MWSLVTGYDSIDISVEDRGRRIVNHFGMGRDRNLLPGELKFHNFYKVVRFLVVLVYRDADKKCSDARQELLDRYSVSNITTHCRVLLRVG